MRPSSHFRFAFLVLSSHLLRGAVSLSSSCKSMCRRRSETGHYDCGTKRTGDDCGWLCEDDCTSSDCDYSGDVNCAESSSSDYSSGGGAIVWVWVGTIVGIILVIAAIGGCVYCCIAASRQPRVGVGVAGGQPMMMAGGGMAAGPQMAYYQPQQPQMQPMGGYGVQQPQPQQPTGGNGPPPQQQQPQKPTGAGNPFVSQSQVSLASQA